MATAAAKTAYQTVADVQERVGDVPVRRLRLVPPPGTATEQDVLDLSATGGRQCELVDGILVEKAVGFREDYVGMWIGFLIQRFALEQNLGAVSGAQGLVRFRAGLVRVPDVAFTRWDSAADPDEIEHPDGAFLEMAPDLVVEVLSEGNTRREMDIKLAEYARAGVKLVWYVDPEREEVTVYPKGRAVARKTLGRDDVLDGGAVLPGFALPVKDIFARRAPAREEEGRAEGVTAAHRIRLAGFWAAAEVSPGVARYTRRFGRPRALGPGETAWLVGPGGGAVALNGEVLGDAAGPWAFDVTAKLLPRNEVAVEGPPGSEPAGVELEIRPAGGERASIV